MGLRAITASWVWGELDPAPVLGLGWMSGGPVTRGQLGGPVSLGATPWLLGTWSPPWSILGSVLTFLPAFPWRRGGCRGNLPPLLP